LRLQSPAKLRERLQNEAKAINEAEADLRSEISKIGEEMAKLNVSSPDRSPRVQTLGTTLETLESRVREFVEDFTARNDALKNEVEKSLQASELKVKGLDQLYIESSAENELLYDKFNGELGKIVRALRGKGREDKEELVSKVKERSEEAAKVKKENSRLKREVLTLRTLLKGNDCNSCVSANAAFHEGMRKIQEAAEY
jgi:peptidoglycan hydrolase CwlO-like protein